MYHVLHYHVLYLVKQTKFYRMVIVRRDEWSSRSWAESNPPVKMFYVSVEELVSLEEWLLYLDWLL